MVLRLLPRTFGEPEDRYKDRKKAVEITSVEAFIILTTSVKENRIAEFLWRHLFFCGKCRKQETGNVFFVEQAGLHESCHFPVCLY